METGKAIYFDLLSKRKLSHSTIDQIRNHISKNGLRVSPIPTEVIRKGENREKITDYLTRLHLSIVEGNPSWEGLLVGFPGNIAELSTLSVGTPYLRMILYPILDLHHRLQTQFGNRFPCIYFVGERFSDVFLRKFELLK